MVSQGVQGQLALLGLTLCFLGSALVQANVIHTTVQPAANKSPSVGNEMADISPPAVAPPAAQDNISPAGSAANPSAPPAAAPAAPPATGAAAPAEASKELPSTVSPAPAALSTGAPAIHHQSPTTLAPAGLASSLAPVAPTGGHSTVVPAVPVGLHQSVVPSVVVSHSTVLPAVHVASGDQIAPNASKAVCNRFCDYMKPICDSVHKISPKQLFKIQQQFKQFVQRTNGKLSFCFVEHYSFDPTFKVVSQHELNTICASRKSAHTGKGSFHAFESCANNNWDASLDKDLASIAEARTQAQTHAHPASESAVATNIEHEDTELSIINAVVNKVLGAGDAINEKNSDVKVIDVTGSGAKTTIKPILPIVDGLSTVAPLPLAGASSTGSQGDKTKSLLADPKNTVMVFVDDTKKTTLAPALAPALASSLAPALAATVTGNNQTVSSSNETTNSTLVISHNSTTTIKPAVAVLNSTTLSPNVKVQGAHHPNGNATTPLPVLSTKAPASVVSANATTTLKPHHSGNSTAGVASTVSPTTSKPSSPGNATTPAGATVAASTKAPAPTANTTSTLAPVKKVATAAPSLSTSTPAHTTSASKSTLAPNSTTPASKSTTLAPAKVATTVAAAAGNKTTSTTVAAKAARPIETLEQILSRQEKEKAVLEKKLKIERQKAIKQLEKKEDEMDAKSKVKQAKPARNSADAKLHQMEHERQMAVDPVGHTIKHQQYELNKQQKLAAKKQQ